MQQLIEINVDLFLNNLIVLVCNFCFSNSPSNKANIFLGLIEYELNSLLGASHLVDYISVHIRFDLERYLLNISNNDWPILLPYPPFHPFPPPSWYRAIEVVNAISIFGNDKKYICSPRGDCRLATTFLFVLYCFGSYPVAVFIPGHFSAKST